MEWSVSKVRIINTHYFQVFRYLTRKKHYIKKVLKNKYFKTFGEKRFAQTVRLVSNNSS